MSTVFENAALGMIARFHQTDGMAVRQDFGAPISQALQVLRCLKATTVIAPDKLFDSAFSIASNGRKDLFSNGKDMPPGLTRKPVIEHSNFEGSRSVLLRDQRSPRLLQIAGCLLSRRD